MLRPLLTRSALSLVLFGCAAQPAPIRTQAALGKVVVYRNGVAYFERSALVTDGQLKLTVPVARVDDFLKSLKIVDAKTGESLPVSFKTMAPSADETEMLVSVPGKSARDLRVSYVTDSPAWKPSYRVVLGKKSGKAELEAWAVVDNVSGEDWRQVTVGVGSTSALSFRYDLHSVRMVERESLGDEAALALAPPTGGSPYAVASSEVPVVGELGGGMVERLLNGPAAVAQGMPASPAEAAAEARRAPPKSGSAFARKKMMAMESLSPDGFAGGGGATLGGGRPPSDDSELDRLAGAVLRQAGKVKLQGYARSGDKDLHDAALARANVVRDRLISRGVPPEKVEAVTAGSVNDAQAVRIVAEPPAAVPQQAQREGDEAKDPIGNAYFVARVPMTIEKDRSAMVSLLKTEAGAERVYFYDPISSRGSQSFAFQAVRLENPSEYTLDRGPFTVYSEGQFLGEGLSDAIPPRSVAFIPFALDRQVIVEPTTDVHDELSRLVTIDRGIITAEARKVRTTSFSLHNRGDAEVRVYVRHAVAPGWELRPTKLPMERLSGSFLFPVKVPARGAVKVSLEEDSPTTQTIDLHTTPGATSVGLYLRTDRTLPPKLRTQLEEILQLYREMADVEQHLATLSDQSNEYRKRVDELNEQLFTLRRVKTAQELSRHLAKKMQEMSERLQAATIKVTDLQQELMTRRIGVQDRLADLTLRPDPDSPRVADAAAR